MLATLTTTLVLSTAIVTTDPAALRAAPRDSARQQAQLNAGEMVEVRGERLDYLQVWDHQRERGGFVRATQLRRVALTPAEAPQLLAVLRHVQGEPDKEALGIGYAAAYLKAASVPDLQGEGGAQAFDALGSMAERLAQRASAGTPLSKPAEAALSAQLEVARRYGVHFDSHEQAGRMQVCYDGEAFRRVLAMAAATAEQKARAALAVTRTECVDPALGAVQRLKVDEWRSGVLDRVDASSLPGYLKNRVAMRRAAVHSALAWQRARQGLPADGAAQRALAELAGVSRDELPDDDLPLYNDAAMRVNATRWAALPAPAAGPGSGKGPTLITQASDSGETCVLLVDAQHDAKNPLLRRCTYSLVWAQSASRNREGTALALAVQPLEGWRELWLLRKGPAGWTVSVLPPAPTSPELGYAEFAGWVPGGQQVLVAREARGDGKYRRNYEVLSLASLAPDRQSGDPSQLGAFQRWQDADWKRMSTSVR